MSKSYVALLDEATRSELRAQMELVLDEELVGEADIAYPQLTTVFVAEK